MTVFEWQADVIEQMGTALAHALATTREDRIAWRPQADPESRTRSALDQAAECIDVNRRCAALMRGETPPPPRLDWPFNDGGEAQEQVRQSARELAAAVRALDEEALTRLYPTAAGPMPGAMLLRITAGNLAYHFGQVNYIQTLYGDIEFHLPPG